MTNELALISRVLPSGAARATASVPITEPARGRVLNHYRDPLRPADLLRQHTGKDVVCGARWERNDDLDCSRCLGPRNFAGQHQEHRNKSENSRHPYRIQKLTAWKFHDVPRNF